MSDHSWNIEDILHRRTDLSTFVIHWTKDQDEHQARDNLVSILTDRTIKAFTAMGGAVHILKESLADAELAEALESQRVACFTEAPLEHAWSFVCDIQDRAVKLKPYGLAFTKKRAREMGINPVWYLDSTPSGYDWVIKSVWKLVEDALAAPDPFTAHPVARIAPFVERMEHSEFLRKDFWWEREWRHLGSRSFQLEDVAVVFCPDEEIEEFQAMVKDATPGRRLPVISPNWGLERIIADLSGVQD